MVLSRTTNLEKRLHDYEDISRAVVAEQEKESEDKKVEDNVSQ